jgi:hypothetical protein
MVVVVEKWNQRRRKMKPPKGPWDQKVDRISQLMKKKTMLVSCCYPCLKICYQALLLIKEQNFKYEEEMQGCVCYL